MARSDVLPSCPGRPLPVVALVAAACALLAAAPSQADGRTRIALLPMVVHSAEPPEYLRSGLSDMLASRLQRIPDFEVVRVEEEGAATTNLDKARKRARKAGAAFVLFGSFTRFGTGASLDVQCAGVGADDTAEEPLREIFVHSGSIGDVIPDLDDLVGKVARFVIADYSDKAAAQAAAQAGAGATGAGSGASSASVRQLEDRVAALEKALQDLNRRLEARPADVAGTP